MRLLTFRIENETEKNKKKKKGRPDQSKAGQMSVLLFGSAKWRSSVSFGY